MIYDFKISGDRISSSGITGAVAGSSNYYKCRFDFSEEWADLLKFVVFAKGDEAYTVMLDGNICTIPEEVLSSPAPTTIGVYGAKEGDEVFRISTDLSHIVIKEGAYREGTTPSIPEKDDWEIYFARAAEEATKAATDAIRAETGDIDATLDAIIEIQNILIGGGSE